MRLNSVGEQFGFWLHRMQMLLLEKMLMRLSQNARLCEAVLRLRRGQAVVGADDRERLKKPVIVGVRDRVDVRRHRGTEKTTEKTINVVWS